MEDAQEEPEETSQDEVSTDEIEQKKDTESELEKTEDSAEDKPAEIEETPVDSEAEQVNEKEEVKDEVKEEEAPPDTEEDVTEDAKVEEVTEEAKEEDVTEEAKVEEVTEEAKVEDVTEEAKVEEVTEEAKEEEVTEEAKEEEVTEEAKEEEVTEEAKVEDVVKDKKVKKKADKPKKKATKKKGDEFDSESMGLGPSEFAQPQFELHKEEVVEVLKEADLTPEEEEFGITIFAIKTSIGHEKMVADRIISRSRKRKLSVYSALSPTKLRGYVLIECLNNRDAVKDLIKGIEHVRNVVEGETTLDEIEHFLTPKPLVFGIMEGDIVEIISGPFKGEKAKVQQIDESKEEITVELFEAMVSIPVTIRGDHVRVLEKESA
jgi:transcriptional antiterminator NusG